MHAADTPFPGRRINFGARFSSVLLLAATAFYLAARLPSLLALPIFNDEAVYLLRAAQFPSELTQTTADGKLIQELLLAALALLPGDPLVPARLLSVAAGLGTIAGLWFCGRALGSAAAGAIGGLLYAAAPIALLHDLLAIPDSLLTCAATCVLLASIRYGSSGQVGRRQAAGLGVLIGVAALVKLPGLFLIAVPAIITLGLSAPGERLQRVRQLRTALLVALVFVASLAPLHYGGAERAKLGVSASESRLAQIGDNSVVNAGWLATYLPITSLTVALAGLAWPCGRRTIGTLLLAGLSVLLLFVVVGGTLAPRYLLPAWPPLLLAAAFGARSMWRATGPPNWPWRTLSTLGLAASVGWGALFAAQLAREPAQAAMVPADRHQYLQAWTAGYAIRPIVTVLEAEAVRHGNIVLINHDQPRLAHLGPTIYLHRDPRISIRTVDLRAEDAAEQVRASAGDRPSYLVLDDQEWRAFAVAERFPELRLLRRYDNPHSQMRYYLLVYP